MQNRIASLFELDDLLSGKSNGHNGHPRPARRPKRARKAAAPNVTRATPTPGPYVAAKKRRRRATGSAPIAQSFDTGSPIRCEHSVAYQPVAPVQVPDESLTSPPAMASALDVGDEYTVEAFEEDEEEDDKAQISEAEVEISLDDTSAAQSTPYSPTAYAASARANYERAQPAQPATFAAQMSAVERDLADLASRVQAPAPPSAPAPSAEETDEASAPAAQPHKPPQAGHGVFEAMAHGMSYATEFRLPPVKIAEVFSALDRQLDVDQVQEIRAAPVARPVDRTTGTTAPNVEPLPPNDVLIKDLVGLTPQVGEPAPALAAAAIDVRHDVQLVPQLTGFSCWAAGAAMLVGWREKMSIDPSEVARATGYWAQYASGLHPEDVTMFKVWRLTPEPAQSYTVQGFADLLKKHGPLWVASAEPGPHIRVVTGMVGDGTATGTLVYINDPWEQGMTSFKPSNRGSRYTETYQRFVEKQESLGRQEIKLQGIYVAHN